MTKPNLDYVTSKFDYRVNEVIDLYTLRLRRTNEESKDQVLKDSLVQLLNGLNQ